MEKFLIVCLCVLAVLAFWVGIGLLVSWALMWAWNILVPALLHGPSITYTMAVAIYVIVTFVGGAFKSVSSSPSKS